MIRALALVLASTLSASAGPVLQVEPEPLAARLSGLFDFETLPLAPEPGVNYDEPIAAPGLRIGAAFEGQTVSGALHDRLTGRPTGPLTLSASPSGQALASAFHPGFGSNALFGLGPHGGLVVSGRGEGSIGVRFEKPVRAVALLLHADYDDPLAVRPPPGTATITFFALDGALIDSHVIALGAGVQALGFEARSPGDAFAGFTLTNDDPGGIAVDDIRFPLDEFTG